MVLVLPMALSLPMLMTKEEKWRFIHGQDTEMGVDLGLGCPPNDL